MPSPTSLIPQSRDRLTEAGKTITIPLVMAISIVSAAYYAGRKSVEPQDPAVDREVAAALARQAAIVERVEKRMDEAESDLYDLRSKQRECCATAEEAWKQSQKRSGSN